jgi:hypothetical protein
LEDLFQGSPLRFLGWKICSKAPRCVLVGRFVSILPGAPTLEDLFQSSPVRLPWKICFNPPRCAYLGRFVPSFSGAPPLEDLFHPSPVRLPWKICSILLRCIFVRDVCLCVKKDFPPKRYAKGAQTADRLTQKTLDNFLQKL